MPSQLPVSRDAHHHPHSSRVKARCLPRSLDPLQLCSERAAVLCCAKCTSRRSSRRWACNSPRSAHRKACRVVARPVVVVQLLVCVNFVRRPSRASDTRAHVRHTCALPQWTRFACSARVWSAARHHLCAKNIVVSRLIDSAGSFPSSARARRELRGRDAIGQSDFHRGSSAAARGRAAPRRKGAGAVVARRRQSSRVSVRGATALCSRMGKFSLRRTR
jgi:hypothetical protein